MLPILLALVACAPDTDPVPDSCDEMPTGAVTLPADEAIHDQPVEWWYWTGHLRDPAGRWFGFEQTFFAVQAGPVLGRSVHVGLTDIDDATLHHHVVYEDGGYGAMENGFDLAMAGQSAAGANGTETLDADFGDVSWALSLEARKPPVFQHGDGYHDYDVGGYTWYYSRERIDVEGSLEVGGTAREVTGQAWFDHQWGNLLSTTNAGWDWFALQLDDDREIMLFLVRGSEDVIGGSITDAACNTREIDPAELTVTPTGEWTSPATGCTYPFGWEVSLGDLDLVVTPLVDDQEMVNDYKTYWEGTCAVTGDATGRAYVELAGYCD